MRAIILLAFALLCGSVHAQYVQTNPLEWLALAEGNDAINEQIEKQVKGQTQTALLQNTIAGEFTKIQEWEQKYSDYLTTASGYASTLKAATTLYEDGVRIFITLGKLRKAVADNPQGIFASMSMNNLYIETATELVSVYTLLRSAVATGGTLNMLTGAERSQIMWQLSDKLSAFNKKLTRLHLSISYYTLTDVWSFATAGMLNRDNADAANEAFSHWKRVAKSVK